MHLWHSLTTPDLYTALETGQDGLTSAQVEQRLKQYGYNELKVKGEPLWKKIIEPFRSIFVVILLFAALISFLSHEVIDSFIILAIVVINATIFYTQQHATSRVLRSLKKHSEQLVQVLRDKTVSTISSRLLVPGDVILLSEGQRIPADARVISEENLYTNESALTGESLPVKKTTGVLEKEKALYLQTNMLFQGSYIVAGTCQAIVVTTGSQTEFGRIAKLATKEQTKSPMQQKIDHIVNKLIRILVFIALVVFGLSLLRGIPTQEALRFVMSMSVSAIPEDLPIALTVVLVLGMRRMAKKNALVRSTKAIEDIGLVTTIATDKTGTLTKNDLHVVEVWSPKASIDLKQAGLLAMGNTLNVVEPFDQALKKFASSATAQGNLIKSYPFNQQQRMSGAVWRDGSKTTLYIKGAPEHLLSLCKASKAEHTNYESELRRLVSQGFRVITIARASVNSVPTDLTAVAKIGFEFLGFVAFADELRAESKDAIAAAQRAGISVKMITGDHYETAFHIGQALGISTHRDQVIQGNELPSNQGALAAIIKTKTVFARILPEQKFNILQALKRTEITAMTGDGVNDVPALTNAHVGIAVGSGNDIAKDAGDIVLLDDNFASIVSAVSEGRIIYDNIRRMLFYLLSTSLGEVLTMIGALLVGLPLPVTAIQILWVNLVTDTALVIPLGLEPAEEDHMQQPPRHPKAPILDKLILTRIVLVGAAMMLVTLIIFNQIIKRGYSLEYAQTVAFTMLVVAQWANALNARSERLSLLRRAKAPNYKMLVGFTLAVLLQLLVTFGPLKATFGVQRVETGHLLIGTVASMAAVYIIVEIHKFITRPKHKVAQNS